MTSPAARDESGIRFPPPFIYGIFFLAGYGVHRLVPGIALFGNRPQRGTIRSGWAY